MSAAKSEDGRPSNFREPMVMRVSQIAQREPSDDKRRKGNRKRVRETRGRWDRV